MDLLKYIVILGKKKKYFRTCQCKETKPYSSHFERNNKIRNTSNKYFDKYAVIIFFLACERAEFSKSCNLIGFGSGRKFSILPAHGAIPPG